MLPGTVPVTYRLYEISVEAVAQFADSGGYLVEHDPLLAAIYETDREETGHTGENGEKAALTSLHDVHSSCHDKK